MVRFENSRTVETFKAENRTSKLFFSKAFIGSGAEKKPLTYKSADGSDTGIQKVALLDEAGTTIGWCALAVARDIHAGKNPANSTTGVAIVDAVDEESGVVYPNKMVYPASNNRVEGLSM